MKAALITQYLMGSIHAPCPYNFDIYMVHEIFLTVPLDRKVWQVFEAEPDAPRFSKRKHGPTVEASVGLRLGFDAQEVAVTTSLLQETSTFWKMMNFHGTNQFTTGSRYGLI